MAEDRRADLQEEIVSSEDEDLILVDEEDRVVGYTDLCETFRQAL